MERSRRARFTTIVPTAGEAMVAAVLAGLVLALATPLVVQAATGWATTGVFATPNGHLPDAYGGLLHGHFGTGLPARVADALPPDQVMWLVTVLGEVLVLGAGVAAVAWMRDLTGPTSRHGLATRAQAATALGAPRLRATARVIRPDLYPRRRTPRRGTDDISSRHPHPVEREPRP